ncbi:MAG: Na(+)/H(+) antiporter subunit B [Pseudomonadales bacterium]|nr:Na(+)/H(+) antiporter subunit B [Pseudomonadales bacterium]
MHHNIIVREVANLFFPIIILFGLYVQFHGDFGPGGGFQAGVIIAVGIILYALVHGLDKTRRLIPEKAVRIGMSLGVLLYAGVGVVTLLLGAEFLNYNVLVANPLTGQHLGIFLIELGVGITVATVMVMIFYAFAGRGQE